MASLASNTENPFDLVLLLVSDYFVQTPFSHSRLVVYRSLKSVCGHHIICNSAKYFYIILFRCILFSSKITWWLPPKSFVTHAEIKDSKDCFSRHFDTLNEKNSLVHWLPVCNCFKIDRKFNYWRVDLITLLRHCNCA